VTVLRRHPGTIKQGVRSVSHALIAVAQIFAPPVLRIALAVPFFRSGLTKFTGIFSLSPHAVLLFEEEFKLHIFGSTYDFPAPAAAALIDAVAEIVLPIMLILGLATRLSALALLIMTAIIQLVVPEGWAYFHLPWAALALALIALGPGPLSVDYLLEQRFGGRGK
jgi:putative oxidoreductase